MAASPELIAIVGVGCRFPGARNVQEFWRLLRDGVNAVSEVPKSRFDVDVLFDPTPGVPGKLASRWGGFIHGVDLFDAEFFGISGRDACGMDPQQRLALEVAWEALDDGGLVPHSLRGSATGVFLGIHRDEYATLVPRSRCEVDLLAAVGGSRDGAAGRLSHALGLAGPSLVVSTDRSSSLVAVHLACQSIRRRESSMAIAGGTNLILSPQASLAFSRAGLLAPDGRCKFADARADGIVRSDGVGLVVLKPLDAAMAAGDQVYAVIRGSAVNHDGGRSSDFMTPSSFAQISLLRAAYESAGVDPADVDYVEAHGTGTAVGDPVEIEALATVLQDVRSNRPSLRIGSCKTNIGHAESAAGIAGLIKVALSLKHRVLPPSLHFENPNPKIPFRGITVQTEMEPWGDARKELVAGVTSLGLTGTNAHIVLGQGPRGPITRSANTCASRPEVRDSVPGREEILVLSARTSAALAALAHSHAIALSAKGGGEFSAYDWARASAVRRSHFDQRLAVVGRSQEELAAELTAFVERGEAQALTCNPKIGPAKVVFVFSGQGSQWRAMGLELLKEEPVFRASMDRCEALIHQATGWSLREELALESDHSRLDQTQIMQPAIFALSVSLAALWQHWGVEPDVVIGTSMGEIGAAHVAGILSLEDAVHVVCTRSRLMRCLDGKGAVLLAELSAEHLGELLTGLEHAVSIAAYHGPTSTLLSGQKDAIEEVVGRMRSANIVVRRVNMGVASHSPQMDRIAAELTRALGNLNPRPSQIPMVSTVTGRPVEGEELDADYWVRNGRQPILFSQVIGQLREAGCNLFVETSPHPVLLTPLRRCSAQTRNEPLVVGSLRRGEPERKALLRSLGELYAAGLAVDLTKLFAQPGKHVDLPTYPWQHKRYWHAPSTEEVLAQSAAPSSPPPQGDEAPSPPVMPAPLAERLAAATPSGRRELLTEYLKRQISRTVGLSPSEIIDVTRPFRELGLTSLLAEEIRHALGRALGKALPVTVLFDYPNVHALAQYLAEEPQGRVPSRRRIDQPPAASGAMSQPDSEQGLAKTDAGGNKRTQAAPLGERRLQRELASLTSIHVPVVAAEQLERAKTRGRGEPIAVIGMACRFPGADSTDAFWRMLHEGVDAISEIPKQRWNADEFYDVDASTPGRMAVRWGGFVRQIDCFDAEFFGISPREAERMDPQQRMLLEVAWEALECAGHAPRQGCATDTGVFIGMMNNNEYAALRAHESLTMVTGHDSAGNAGSVASGRLSYFLGFRGPCISVDTACSSSLVAVHLAGQALRSGECRMALVGGVNAILAPKTTLEFAKRRMLSPRGRCRTFDKSADGYVRSEGCGLVVLKCLADALVDGDNILAVIRGSAVNQDGRTSGLSAPSGLAQADVIRQALSNAGVLASEIDYVEAHGTGTRLGDPIEGRTLGAVLGQGRDAKQKLVMGSVKTNIGHLEAAAGVAGLIKVILSLTHEEIPKHLHLEAVNPHLSLDEIAVTIPTAALPWRRGDRRRVAGVSSFGFSGTNAHVVVEEPPVRPDEDTRELPSDAHIVCLSARTERALDELRRTYGRFARNNATVPIRDIALTTNTGRAHFAHRLAVVANGTESLGQALASTSQSAVLTGVAPEAGAPKVAFLYSGHGSHYPRMGYELFQTQPVFRMALRKCAELFTPHVNRPLLEVMFDSDPSAMKRPIERQSALFSLQVALTEMWRSWGVEPACVLGHSLGEHAAACAAGILELGDAVQIVARCAALVDQLHERGMALSVKGAEERVAAVVGAYSDDAAIAAYDGPDIFLVAGTERAIRAISKQLEAESIEVKAVDGLIDFHSTVMDPVLEQIGHLVPASEVGSRSTRFVSTVEGRVLRHDEPAHASYWKRLVREPVQFRSAMAALLAEGCDVFVELGPRQDLLRLGRGCAPPNVGTWLPSMREERPGRVQALESLAALYVHGVDIDWPRVHGGDGGRRVPLPTYPFQRKSYWVPHTPPAQHPGAPATPEPSRPRRHE